MHVRPVLLADFNLARLNLQVWPLGSQQAPSSLVIVILAI